MTVQGARMLAVVRCGDHSLHTSWANGEREFDVAVSYFGNDAERQFPEADFVHRLKGGKWDGLFEFFQTFPDLADRYDFFWFPDDDVLSSPGDVSALVEMGRKYNLDLFQPALDERSYYSHVITRRNSSFMLRYTNFVEIMVPFLSRALLAKALPTFNNTRSGFGLDFVWPTLAAELGNQNTAIIDAVCVTHTRPIGGNLQKFIKNSGGPNSLDEMSETLSNTDADTQSQIDGVKVPRIRIYSAIHTSGKRLSTWSAAPLIAKDLLISNPNEIQKVKPIRILRHLLKMIG